MPDLRDPMNEKRSLKRDYRDHYEVAFELASIEMTPVVIWLKDSDRKWKLGEKPLWIRELDQLPTELAMKKVEVRMHAMAFADALIQTTRPDLSDSAMANRIARSLDH